MKAAKGSWRIKVCQVTQRYAVQITPQLLKCGVIISIFCYVTALH
jgi:hypothetical protein